MQRVAIIMLRPRLAPAAAAPAAAGTFRPIARASSVLAAQWRPCGAHAPAANSMQRRISTCAVRRAAPQPAQSTPQPSSTAPAAATPPAAASPSAAATPVSSTPSSTATASTPAIVPLSLVDLSTAQPRLPKHSQHGFLVYSSPMEKALRAVKMFSLSSATMALLSAPVMMILAPPAMSIVARSAIAGTVIVFGVSTTIALTYFTRSYVVRIFAKKRELLGAGGKQASLEQAIKKARELQEEEEQRAEAATAAAKAASETPASDATASTPTPAAAAADAAAPPVSRSPALASAWAAADRLTAESWILTVETLNVWGRSVFTSAPHSGFHPLFSKLFNNLRMEVKPADVAAAKEDVAESKEDAPAAKQQPPLGLTPLKKDLFIHMDLATNPLLLPLWVKPTVLSRNLTPLEAEHREEQAALKGKTQQSQQQQNDDSMSREKAHKIIEAHKAEQAAKAAAVAAAAAKSDAAASRQ